MKRFVVLTGSWVLIAGALFSAPRDAHAQQDTQAVAEKLFQEGRAFLAEGRYPEACAKLAESLRLDPAVGTMLNLADCYEHIEKLASAWVTYRRAATLARRANQRERFVHATSRSEALESKLSHLTVMVTPGAKALKGLTVMHDGEVIGEAAWNTPVPVDGGRHTIEVSAPGFRSWKKEVRVAFRADDVKVEIPALTRAPEEGSKPGDVGPGASESAVQKTLGFISLAGGAAALGVGFGFGAIAKSTRDDAASHCSAVDCDAQGVSLTRDAKSEALLSTIFVSVGAGLALGGALLVLFAPKTARSSTTIPRLRDGAWVAF